MGQMGHGPGASRSRGPRPPPQKKKKKEKKEKKERKKERKKKKEKWKNGKKLLAQIRSTFFSFYKSVNQGLKNDL